MNQLMKITVQICILYDYFSDQQGCTEDKLKTIYTTFDYFSYSMSQAK